MYQTPVVTMMTVIGSRTFFSALKIGLMTMSWSR